MARGRLAGTVALSARQASLLRGEILRKFPPTSTSSAFERAAESLIPHDAPTREPAHLAKQLARALGGQAARRVLTQELRRHFETLVGRTFLDRALALGSRKSPSIEALRGADRERDLVAYQALKEKGLYEECIDIARPRSAQAAAEKKYVEAAIWKAHEFSCLRSLGRLTDAFHSAKDALRILNQATKRQRSEPEALLLALRLEFGITIASVTMQAADFARGLAAHKKIEKRALMLARNSPNSSVRKEAHFYALHTRRQQTECLRYLGRYNEALEAARTLENAYPPGDAQPRFWTRIYQADNLRLLGRFDEARELLISLEEVANLRRQQASPLAILWRRLALESVAQPAKTESVCKRIEHNLAAEDPGSLWGASYAHLALASVRVNDFACCQDHIEAFNRACEGIASIYVLEEGYAHLITGEMERGRAGRKAAARAAYLKAAACFDKGGVRWGILRAVIGLALTSRDGAVSSTRYRLEGLDRTLLEAVRAGKEFPIGTLCRNFP